MLAQAGVGESLQDMLSQVIALLPKIVAFLAILIIGWFVAKVIAKVLDRVLEKVGFDRAVERGGVGRALEPTDYDASSILARIVFYALMLFVLQLAFGIFGPNPISELLFGVIAFLPRIFVAIVIVVIAAAIASAVRDMVATSLGGLSYGRVLANVASGVILVVGVFAALDQLRVAPAIVTGLFYAMLAIVVGSAVIAIGGGGIAPMRRQWERAIGRVEEEAPRMRRAAREDDATQELRREPAHEPPHSSTTSYDQLDEDQLIDLAQERDLEGRSDMSKDELVEALRIDDRTHELRR